MVQPNNVFVERPCSSWKLKNAVTSDVYRLRLGRTTIGSHPKSDIKCFRSYVEGHHAYIDVSLDNKTVTIYDLNTMNGIYVNDERIKNEANLEIGDSLGIGVHPFFALKAELEIPVYTLKYSPLPSEEKYSLKLNQNTNKSSETNLTAAPTRNSRFSTPTVTSDIVIVIDDDDEENSSIVIGNANLVENSAQNCPRVTQNSVAHTFNTEPTETSATSLQNSVPSFVQPVVPPLLHMPKITETKQEFVDEVTETMTSIFGEPDENILNHCMEHSPYVYNALCNRINRSLNLEQPRLFDRSIVDLDSGVEDIMFPSPELRSSSSDLQSFYGVSSITIMSPIKSNSPETNFALEIDDDAHICPKAKEDRPIKEDISSKQLKESKSTHDNESHKNAEDQSSSQHENDFVPKASKNTKADAVKEKAKNHKHINHGSSLEGEYKSKKHDSKADWSNKKEDKKPDTVIKNKRHHTGHYAENFRKSTPDGSTVHNNNEKHKFNESNSKKQDLPFKRSDSHHGINNMSYKNGRSGNETTFETKNKNRHMEAKVSFAHELGAMPTTKSIKRTLPVIIEAPRLPNGRGKLRGVSAVPPKYDKQAHKKEAFAKLRELRRKRLQNLTAPELQTSDQQITEEASTTGKNITKEALSQNIPGMNFQLPVKTLPTNSTEFSPKISDCTDNTSEKPFVRTAAASELLSYRTVNKVTFASQERNYTQNRALDAKLEYFSKFRLQNCAQPNQPETPNSSNDNQNPIHSAKSTLHGNQRPSDSAMPIRKRKSSEKTPIHKALKVSKSAPPLVKRPKATSVHQ